MNMKCNFLDWIGFVGEAGLLLLSLLCSICWHTVLCRQTHCVSVSVLLIMVKPCKGSHTHRCRVTVKRDKEALYSSWWRTNQGQGLERRWGGSGAIGSKGIKEWQIPVCLLHLLPNLFPIFFLLWSDVIEDRAQSVCGSMMRRNNNYLLFWPTSITALISFFPPLPCLLLI